MNGKKITTGEGELDDLITLAGRPAPALFFGAGISRRFDTQKSEDAEIFLSASTLYRANGRKACAANRPKSCLRQPDPSPGSGATRWHQMDD